MPSLQRRRRTGQNSGEGRRQEGDTVLNLNIRGRVYQTTAGKLSRYPDTRLARLARAAHNKGTHSLTVFFDTNPDMVNSVLDFYTTGQLHLPTGVCAAECLRELEFWGVPHAIVAECCWHRVLALWRGAKTLEHITLFLQDPYQGGVGARGAQWRERAFSVLEQRDHSWRGKAWRAAYLTAVCLSLLLHLVDIDNGLLSLRTHGQAHTTTNSKHSNDSNNKDSDITVAWTPLDAANGRPAVIRILQDLVFVFFAAEFVARLAICPKRLRQLFLQQRRTKCDLLLLFPECLVVALHVLWGEVGPTQSASQDVTQVLLLLYILLLLRACRLVHLATHCPLLQVVILTLRASAPDILLLAVCSTALTAIFGSLVFIAEHASRDYTVTTVWQGMWWAVVTMTTVGYGEAAPVGGWGRVVGAVCAVSGVVFLALLFVVIARHFSRYQDSMACRDHLLERLALTRRFSPAGNSHANPPTVHSHAHPPTAHTRAHSPSSIPDRHSPSQAGDTSPDCVTGHPDCDTVSTATYSIHSNGSNNFHADSFHRNGHNTFETGSIHSSGCSQADCIHGNGDNVFRINNIHSTSDATFHTDSHGSNAFKTESIHGKGRNTCHSDSTDRVWADSRDNTSRSSCPSSHCEEHDTRSQQTLHVADTFGPTTSSTRQNGGRGGVKRVRNKVCRMPASAFVVRQPGEGQVNLGPLAICTYTNGPPTHCHTQTPDVWRHCHHDVIHRNITPRSRDTYVCRTPENLPKLFNSFCTGPDVHGTLATVDGTTHPALRGIRARGASTNFERNAFSFTGDTRERYVSAGDDDNVSQLSANSFSRPTLAHGNISVERAPRATNNRHNPAHVEMNVCSQPAHAHSPSADECAKGLDGRATAQREKRPNAPSALTNVDGNVTSSSDKEFLYQTTEKAAALPTVRHTSRARPHVDRNVSSLFKNTRVKRTRASVHPSVANVSPRATGVERKVSDGMVDDCDSKKRVSENPSQTSTHGDSHSVPHAPVNVLTDKLTSSKRKHTDQPAPGGSKRGVQRPGPRSRSQHAEGASYSPHDDAGHKSDVSDNNQLASASSRPVPHTEHAGTASRNPASARPTSSGTAGGIHKYPKAASPGLASPKAPDAGLASPKAANAWTTSPKAANAWTTPPKAANAWVTSPKTANAWVTSRKAAYTGVTSHKAANAEVTSPKAAYTGVTSPKAANAGLTSSKAANAGVTSPTAANAGVTSPKAANAWVRSTKAANAGVASPKAANAGQVSQESANARLTSPNSANAGPRSPDSANAGPRSPDSANAGPRSPDSTYAGPRSPDSANAGPRSPISANAGLRSPDSTYAGPRSPDIANAGPRSQNAATDAGLTAQEAADYDSRHVDLAPASEAEGGASLSTCISVYSDTETESVDGYPPVIARHDQSILSSSTFDKPCSFLD